MVPRYKDAGVMFSAFSEMIGPLLRFPAQLCETKTRKKEGSTFSENAIAANFVLET